MIAIPPRLLKFYVNGDSGCWVWHGATLAGYGVVWGSERHRALKAHRVMYEALKGPIPEGLTLDHLCRVTACVNPAHLEPVTIRENILRGNAPPAINARRTECGLGHPFDQANTYIRPDGRRVCKACRVRWRPSKGERKKQWD